MKTNTSNNIKFICAPNRGLPLWVILCTFGLIFSATATPPGPVVTPFDAPGAGTAANQGTFPGGINTSGAIAGFIRDPNNVRQAFLRTKNGAFTVFNAPGAGTATFQGTRAYGLSEGGSISGWYIDAAGVVHGYVRANNGSFTTFDAPNAGTGPYPQGTFPFGFNSINNAGAITGTPMM